jgi:hypothetical protein
MSTTTTRVPWLRAVVALAASAMIGGALAAGPATAHLGSFEHLRKHFLNRTDVITRSDSVDEGQVEGKTVLCPARYQAIGGGASGTNPPTTSNNLVTVDASGPTVNGAKPGTTPTGTNAFADGWYVQVTGQGPGAQPYRVSVVCVRPRR